MLFQQFEALMYFTQANLLIYLNGEIDLKSSTNPCLCRKFVLKLMSLFAQVRMWVRGLLKWAEVSQLDAKSLAYFRPASWNSYSTSNSWQLILLFNVKMQMQMGKKNWRV